MAEITRRRLLMVAASTAVMASLPKGARAEDSDMLRWTGRCLGAEAEIKLYHHDGAAARAAIADAVEELERLEKAISLFHPDSALVQLNQKGVLDNPPLDLVRAIGEANAVSAASNGAFDITVQPVWQAYADSLTADGHAPSAKQLAELRQLVDWRLIELSPERIRLPRAGMALTLNGMGQGYITDRVSELMARRGFPHVLVDLGEMRAPAAKPDGQPWSVAVRDPRDITKDLRTLDLARQGLATSEAYGSSFRVGGHDGHILSPVTLKPALSVLSVTIRAANATAADGLTTAIAAAGLDKAAAIMTAGRASDGLAMNAAQQLRSL